jgi:hypothetical protein
VQPSPDVVQVAPPGEAVAV